MTLVSTSVRISVEVEPIERIKRNRFECLKTCKTMSNKMKAISLTPKRLVFAMLYHWNSLSVESFHNTFTLKTKYLLVEDQQVSTGMSADSGLRVVECSLLANGISLSFYCLLLAALPACHCLCLPLPVLMPMPMRPNYTCDRRAIPQLALKPWLGWSLSRLKLLTPDKPVCSPHPKGVRF